MISLPLTLLLSACGLLLMTSAFFSGTEAAYVAFDRILVNRHEEKNNFFSRRIRKFLTEIDQVIICLLFFNLANNTLFTWLAASIHQQILSIYFPGRSVSDSLQAVLFMFGVPVLLMIFGEITPKRLAIRFPEQIALAGVLPLSVMLFIFRPFSLLLSSMSRYIISGIVGCKDGRGELFDKGEFVGYVRLGSDSGLFKKTESTLLENLIQSRQVTAKSVLIPRGRLKGFNLAELPQDLPKSIRSFPHKYIPVFSENADEITGVLCKSELLYLENFHKLNSENLSDFLSKPRVVLETRRLTEVLGDLIQDGREVALVADEYGNLEGMLTLNDTARRLYGRTNADDEQAGIERLSTGQWMLSALTTIEEFNSYFKSKIISSQSTTIGGYLIELSGNIPLPGKVIRISVFEFTIRSSDRRRIYRIVLRKTA